MVLSEARGNLGCGFKFPPITLHSVLGMAVFIVDLVVAILAVVVEDHVASVGDVLMLGFFFGPSVCGQALSSKVSILLLSALRLVLASFCFSSVLVISIVGALSALGL